MRLLILLIPLLVGSAIILGFRFLSSSQAEISALQVTAIPAAEVFLDGTSLGKTPFFNDKLKPGEYTLKLVPQETSGLFNFEQKIMLPPGVLTVVDRIFQSAEAQSETSIISLEQIGQAKGVEIAIVSSPDGSEAKLDEQPQGITPLLLKDLTVSDHQLTISKEGYNQKTLRVRPTEGYRLTLSAKLSIATSVVIPTPTPAATQSAEPVLRDITIRVLNGSGQAGKASIAADFLRDLGYEIAGTGNAPSFTYEKTVLTIKKAKESFLSTLSTDLATKYEVGSTSASLVSSETADAVVVIGKN